MFIQLFIVGVGTLLYLLNAKWYICATIVFVATWIAMAPPRFFLEWLSRSSGYSVIFRLPVTDDSFPVYLTIDDAPSAYTQLILDAIDECRRANEPPSRATFFIIGESAQKYPETVKRMNELGHGLGNHDMKDRMTAAPNRSFKDIRDGLVDTESIINNLFTPRLKWFRPGCGLYTPTVLAVSRDLGYTTVLGDCYGHDVMFDRFPSIIMSWFYAWRVAPGSVMILHDDSERRAKNSADVIRHVFRSNPKIQYRALPEPTVCH